MVGSLVVADGVRLATPDELPGSPDRRDELRAKIEAASIHPGFTLKAARDPAFRYYAEINVDASDIWALFCDLARGVLAGSGTLLLSFKDDEPQSIAEASVADILDALSAHADQLTHDGYVQFGIVTQTEGELNEVFVTPTKHFHVWFNAERPFASTMTKHELERAERLNSLDEYPRVTTRLASSRALIIDDLCDAIVKRLKQP